MNTPVIDDALALAKQLSGLSFDAYMIGATHTHSGGELSYLQADPSILSGASEELRNLYFEHNNRQDPFSREQCVHAIATALIMADRRKENALISTGHGLEEGRVFNRRMRMKNGKTYTHPGKLNPDIVDYAGPVDPEVGVLGAWRKDGSLIGTIINFACHGTCCYEPSTHADWVYYTVDAIRQQMGDEVGVVVMNGACGILTQDVADCLGVEGAAASWNRGIRCPDRSGAWRTLCLRLLLGGERSSVTEGVWRKAAVGCPGL